MLFYFYFRGSGPVVAEISFIDNDMMPPLNSFGVMELQIKITFK